MLRNYLTLLAIASLLAVGHSDKCDYTINGCSCKSDWEFATENLMGCQNPDNDVGGNWCVINAGSCQSDTLSEIEVEDPISRQMRVMQYDRCHADCPLGSGIAPQTNQCFKGNQTISPGCSCLEEWYLDLGDSNVVFYSGCNNPDLDSGGKWCPVVQEVSCDIAGLISLNNILGPSPRTGNKQYYWQYCIPECGGLVKPESYAKSETSDQTEGRTTIGVQSVEIPGTINTTIATNTTSFSIGDKRK